MRCSCLIHVPILASLASAAYCQETRASIAGVITDPSGAAVAGAKVTARNTDTNLTVAASSTPDGAYTIPRLRAGPYELSAEAQGFRKFVRTGIALAVADNARVDIQLTIGSLNESVSVTAELAGVETSQTVMGQLVNNRVVNQLPLNGRSFLTLLQLSAGVIFTPSVGNKGWGGTRPWEAGPAADAFLIQGGRPGTNAFMVEGGLNGTKGGANWIPLTDAVDEIKVATPASDASLGLTGGGVINLTLKAGTNEFHGAASHFLRNSRTDSLTTQVRRTTGVRTQHQWNSFSYMLGGPIIKNKWFFNGGYDGFREMVPFGSGVNTVPTELQRSGDFSQTFNSVGQLVLVYDPLTTRQEGSRFVRTPIAGNRLPASRVATLAKNYASFFPLPNSAGDMFKAGRNFIKPTPMFIGTDAWHVKSAYNWNDTHRTNATVSQSWGIVWGNTQGLERNSPAAQARSPQGRLHASTVLEHTWTANPKTVVTGRLSWDRFVEYNGSTPSLEYDGSNLGYETPVSPYGTHFPAVTIAGMMGLGGPTVVSCLRMTISGCSTYSGWPAGTTSSSAAESRKHGTTY